MLCKQVLSNRAYTDGLMRYLMALLVTYPTVQLLGISFQDGSTYFVAMDASEGCPNNSDFCVRMRDMQGLYSSGDLFVELVNLLKVCRLAVAAGDTCTYLYNWDSEKGTVVAESKTLLRCDYDSRVGAWYTAGLLLGGPGWGDGTVLYMMLLESTC